MIGTKSLQFNPIYHEWLYPTFIEINMEVILKKKGKKNLGRARMLQHAELNVK